MRDEEGRSPRLAPIGGAIHEQGSREMTVGEYLERAIADAQRRVDGLRELKNALPSGYLLTGCSTLALTINL